MNGLEHINVQSNFGMADWAIVLFFVLASTALGVWASRYIRNMDDYVVAGRGVKTYLGVASMIAAEMGLVTVMYSAQQGFIHGFSAFAIAVLCAAAGLLVGFTGFVVLPLRRMRVMTIPEFYERRFSRNIRILGAIILAAAGILNMGMFLKVDSMFVTSVMGINDDFHLKMAMTILVLAVLLYTMLGGMLSVVFTDYMQFTVKAIGLVVVSLMLMSIFGHGSIFGGWTNITTDMSGMPGTSFNPFDKESGMGATFLVWNFFAGLISAAVWQTAVMRATSAENEKVVRRTYTWGAVGFLIRFLIPYFWGICALLFVYQHPQLLKIMQDLGAAAPHNAKAAQDLGVFQLRAMPIALSTLIPAGAIGLLTAAMLVSAMSTYNTYMHTWSAVITQDTVAPLSGRDLDSRTRIRIARIIMACIAVFLLVWGLWYPLADSLWSYMMVTGGIYFTGAFAVLTAGIYWKRASTAGAYAAFICGFGMVLGLDPIKNLVGHNWSGAQVGLTVAATAVVAMVLFSLIFPDRKVEAA